MDFLVKCKRDKKKKRIWFGDTITEQNIHERGFSFFNIFRFFGKYSGSFIDFLFLKQLCCVVFDNSET